jgi:molybdate transport system ATP-binding protein
MLELAIRHHQGDFTLDADIDIGRGLTALFGPSGSGKTTLVNIAAGLLRPTQGRVVFDGETWSDTKRGIFLPPHRRRIGYVFQEGRLFPHMSVLQNLRYGENRLPKGDRREDLDRVTELLGIAPLLDRRPAHLSGGEKQRVALGRALMASPKLLLMDEPLSALDQDLKAQILPYIERIRDDVGVPILYVSHSLDEVARLATGVVTFDHGKAMAAGAEGEALSALPAIGGLSRSGRFLVARVLEQQPDQGLTIAQCRAGRLFLRHADIDLGAKIRVFVPSGDLIVATGTVGAVSTLNRLNGRIVSVLDEGSAIHLTVECGGDLLDAEVTRVSAVTLDLALGREVTLLFKALSVRGDGVLQLTS